MQKDGPYLDFIDNVERIVVSAVREDYTVQCDGHTIRRSRRAARPRILKVRLRSFDRRASAQHDEAGHDDEKQSADLDDANTVGEPVCVFGVEDKSLLQSVQRANLMCDAHDLLSVARL